MTDVWVVIDEDRHADVNAVPFTTEELAVAAARECAGISPGAPVSDEDDEALGEKRLTPAMRDLGWVFFAVYSAEGDSVRVVKRAMNDAAALR